MCSFGPSARFHKLQRCLFGINIWIRLSSKLSNLHLYSALSIFNEMCRFYVSKGHWYELCKVTASVCGPLITCKRFWATSFSREWRLAVRVTYFAEKATRPSKWRHALHSQYGWSWERCDECKPLFGITSEVMFPTSWQLTTTRRLRSKLYSNGSWYLWSCKAILCLFIGGIDLASADILAT